MFHLLCKNCVGYYCFVQSGKHFLGVGILFCIKCDFFNDTISGCPEAQKKQKTGLEAQKNIMSVCLVDYCCLQLRSSLIHAAALER